MKILLVDPPGNNKGLNTGLGYICAVLKEEHDVSVLDLNNIKLGLCGDPNPEMPRHEMERRVADAVDHFQPDLLGVSVKTFTFHKSKIIFQAAKKQKKDLITVAGGAHITLDGPKYLKEVDIDFGVQGEGEYITLELCNALEKQGPINKIPGLLFRKNKNITQNPGKDFISDLDSLPFPAYDKFTSIIENNGVLPEYPILTSRGCVFECSYCSMPTIMGSKWRSQSPERVIKELYHAKKIYGIDSFTVIDDNFTLNLKRAEEICDQLLSEKIDLSWNSQNGIRADRISKTLAIKMKESGCRYVWIGVESADEMVFNWINKGEALDDIVRGIKYLKNAGIRVGGFFITGLPLSSRKSDLKAVDFVKKLDIDAWWFQFIPYPYTKAWDWVQNNGRILRPIEGAIQYGGAKVEPVFETDNYLTEDRIKTYGDIHIMMGYFDRLPESSSGTLIGWFRALKKIAPYGFKTVLLFSGFVIKYYLKAFLRLFFK